MNTLQRQFSAAQRAYDSMTPDEDKFDDTCECGACESWFPEEEINNYGYCQDCMDTLKQRQPTGYKGKDIASSNMIGIAWDTEIKFGHLSQLIARTDGYFVVRTPEGDVETYKHFEILENL